MYTEYLSIADKTCQRGFMPHLAKKQPSASIVDALKKLLFSGTVSTQEEIKAALEDQGYQVNQSKISRLLRKVGAAKIVNEEKQIIYSLPREPVPAKDILAQLVINIVANETIILIRTNPGSASLVARLLDHHKEELNILGTVAGDDTLFVAPKTIKETSKVAKKIKEFLD